MKIYLASDHAGFTLKEEIKKYLGELSYEVEDMGADTETPDDDYPEIIARAAKKVSENPTDKAIIFGGSGQGEAIVANRFPNVRAVVFIPYYTFSPFGTVFANFDKVFEFLKLSREHNDANVLSFGGRFINAKQAKKAVKMWLETPFSGDERHARRIKQIEALNI